MMIIKLKRGYDIVVREEEKNVPSNEIIILGNYSKSNYNATVIVNKNGICPTIRENHGQVIAIIEQAKGGETIEKS